MSNGSRSSGLRFSSMFRSRPGPKLARRQPAEDPAQPAEPTERAPDSGAERKDDDVPPTPRAA